MRGVVKLADRSTLITMVLHFDSALMIIPQLRGFAGGVMSSHIRTMLHATCDRAQAHFQRCIDDEAYAEKAEFAELTVGPNLLSILVSAASQWSSDHPYFHPMVFGVDMWVDFMEERIDFPALRKASRASTEEKVRYLFEQAQRYAIVQREKYRHRELAAAGADDQSHPKVPRTSPKRFNEDSKRGRVVQD